VKSIVKFAVGFGSKMITFSDQNYIV